MIPRANITAWRSHVPWSTNEQVEQDLVLCRALVTMFQHPTVAEQAVFRGGTALHKLFFSPAGRYSEDIDLVQRDAMPIGKLVNAIRETLDHWLGGPKWKQGHGRFTLLYRFETTFEPVVRMRLKIEINTREHFAILGVTPRTFGVDNPWFRGAAELPVYELDELLGTKMRALYQRKKGRDLYDLRLGLESGQAAPRQIVDCFNRYMAHENAPVTRTDYEANLAAKLNDHTFLEDIRLLTPRDVKYDPAAAAALVREDLLSLLPQRTP